MEELSYLEKSKLPYSLLLDPDTRRAAAYTNNHRLIVELASEKLVSYALAHTEKVVAFDPTEHAKGIPEWYPLPGWATEEVQQHMQLLWIERPGADASDEEWLAIPKK